MTRVVPAALLTALRAGTVEPFFAVSMEFDNGALRLCTAPQDKTLGGNVYTRSKNVLGLSFVEEAAGIEARNFTVSLSGIDSQIIANALAEPYQGRVAEVYLGCEGISDFAVIASGFMDTMDIQDDGATADIQLTCESKLVTLERPRIERYTHESQQRLFPGDSGFSYVVDQQDKDLVWGRRSNG